jgi:hypothetical protein
VSARNQGNRGARLDRDRFVGHERPRIRFNRGILARPLYAIIVTVVLVDAVAVVFAVRLVVLHGIRDEIVQRKPVMARDEVMLLMGLLPSCS